MRPRFWQKAGSGGFATPGGRGAAPAVLRTAETGFARLPPGGRRAAPEPRTLQGAAGGGCRRPVKAAGLPEEW